ncbi:uncharacterized protein A4U43_C03F3490 [Asparagus officinalis]|uniref:Serine hydrolase domain-containing protein n=1 Tax=Asparagus officinalis TaxID=4686 RepID=A0A5P1FC14_ASPOF|nr:uncharacterized protein A4U43_C03F3490 [Asparagus officinalis]
MGSLAEDRKESSPVVTGRRPRVLCLHGFRTSGEIMKKQILGKWPDQVTARFDLVFADAPFPAEGKSDVDGIFDPPYYEWFQFDKEFLEYRNFDECLQYIEDLMIKEGPFDGSNSVGGVARTSRKGDNDFLRKHGEALVEEFVDPTIIRHPKGHTVPRLDDKSLELMLGYLQKIEEDLH